MSSVQILRLGLLVCLMVVSGSHQQTDCYLEQAKEALDNQICEISAILKRSLDESKSLTAQAIAEINVDRDRIQSRILQTYAATDIRGDIRPATQAAVLWTRQFGARKVRRVQDAVDDITSLLDRASQQVITVAAGTASASVVGNALRRIKNLVVQAASQITLLTRQIVNNTIRIAQLVALRAQRINQQARASCSARGLQQQLIKLVENAQKAVVRNFNVKDTGIKQAFDTLEANVLEEVQPDVAIANYVTDTENLEDDDDN